MEGLLVLLVLAVLAVPVLLVIALVSISGLRRRVAELEVAHTRLHDAFAASSSDKPVRPASPAQAPPVQATPAPQSAVEPPPPMLDTPAEASLHSRSAASPATAVSASTTTADEDRAASSAERARFDPPPAPERPGPVDIALRAVKRWFTVGNVPVKVGMLVLLAGVASLLKYASDQGWLTLPPALRLAGVAAAAMAGLAFGWRQRDRRPAFALALQGGAIGILLLVVFAAFRIFELLPAAAAFGLSVLLIAGLGVLAVLQDSRTLAVLGVLAGFLAPIWLSSGGGNHVALFSYYAVLNAAIFGIAWFKSWRVLNLLGFAFTWGIGLLWGVLAYTPDKLSSTQPFLLLFFAFYLLIPLLHARRRPIGRRDLIDGCIVFGTPLVAFSLQAALLEGERLPLAFCALGLAVLYAALGWWLKRRAGFAVLMQAYALLAVGFATLSVPLALSANATACVFALEGAALVWLGLRQQRALPQWTGLGLQLAAAVALAIGADGGGHAARAIANPLFMGALLIAVAGFASAWSYRMQRIAVPALAYYAWGLCWWLGNGVREIERFVRMEVRPDALLVFIALSGWLAAEVHRLRPARALSTTTLAALLAAIPIAFLQASAHAHPFGGYGGWAWLAYAALGVRSLRCLRGGDDDEADWAQFAWWLVWPVASSLSGLWLADRFALASGWQLALLVLPWLLLVAASVWRWAWLASPRGARFAAYRSRLQSTLFGVVALWWGTTLFAPGGSAPLPWLPVLNPLELAQLVALMLGVRWLWREAAPAPLVRRRMLLLSAAGFAFVTLATLRAVHHWGGVGWDEALLSSSLAQTSLTVVWSLLGVIAWIAGSRRGQRVLWLAGAVLMGLVLAKLVLVDRQHLGNLLGIGSFIAYGLLCTLVGYFAPAPPRGNDGGATTEEEGS